MLLNVAQRGEQGQFGEVLSSPQRARVALCFAIALAALCACREDPTQIVIAVNTDYAIPSGLDAVRFEVSATGTKVAPVTKELTGKDAHELPITLAVNGRGGQRVDVTVGGYLRGKLRVRVRATAHFVKARILALPMNLLRACESRFEACESLGLTCGSDVGCMSIERAVLDAWQGAPDFDPQGFDASIPTDAGDAPTPHEGDAGANAEAGAVTKDPVVQLALGKQHSCALRDSGMLFCWGSDDSGQLGTGGVCSGVTPASCAHPRLVEGLDAVYVSAGDDFTCAVSRDGHVLCWGPDNAGQLGAGALPPGQLGAYANLPRVVPGLTGIARVEIGGTSACAWSESFTACWGGNKAGQLRADMGSPLYEPERPEAAVTTPDELWLGSENLCAAKNGVLTCRGSAELGVVVDELRDGSNVVFTGGVDVGDVGGQHACAVQQGKLWCWGRADEGQLGNASANGSCMIGVQEVACARAPVAVEDPWGLSAPAIGAAFSCALVRGGKAAGMVACWGNNESGIVDAENVAHVIAKPTLVRDIAYVRLLAAGGRHACVVSQDERVWCWGSNDKGQLGPKAVYGQQRSGPVEVLLD